MIRISTLNNTNELHEAIHLANHIFFDGKPYFEHRYPHVFCLGNLPWLFGLWENEKLVSFVGTYPARLEFDSDCVIDTVALGAVCTSTLAQGKGYSSLLLAHVFKHLSEKEIDLILISGEGKLYQRVGAEKIGKLYEYHFAGEKCHFLDHKVSVFHTLEGFSINTLMEWATHQNYPHFIRSEKEWIQMIEGHLAPFENERNFLVMDFQTKTFVAIKTGYEGTTKIAYLVDGLGTELNQWRILQDQAKHHMCDKAFARFTQPLNDYEYNPISITGTMKILNPNIGSRCTCLQNSEFKDLNELINRYASFKIDNFNFL
jgi:predicted acetyltransferase